MPHARLLAIVGVAAFFVASARPAQADDVLLNEWNAVGTGKSIAEGDSFFGPDFDGNGGNWMELLTVKDVDLRGWQLHWTENEVAANGDPMSEGTLTFADADLWSDIKAGSIIVVIESEDANGQGVVTSTDTSYDPSAGDWDIVISTFQELDMDTLLVTTVTNDGMESEFSVGNDDWQLTIMDASGTVISGPTGEGAADEAGTEIWQGGGISSSEAGSLEGPGRGAPLSCWESITASSAFYDDTKSSSFGLPNVDFVVDFGTYRTVQDLSALRGEPLEGFGDFDNSGDFDLADVEILSNQIRNENHSPCFDLTEDGLVNVDDLVDLVENRAERKLGDADFNGTVDADDYETWNENKLTTDSTWATADFNADGVTDGTDFNIWNANKAIVPPANSSVPEPSATSLFGLGWLLALTQRKRIRFGRH